MEGTAGQAHSLSTLFVASTWLPSRKVNKWHKMMKVGKPMKRDSLVPGVIFDGDDTLWHTQELYDTAKADFLAKLEENGFSRSEAVEILEVEDEASVATLGFSRRRFPMSMVTTLRILSSRYKRNIPRSLEAELMAIGNSVFQQDPKLIDEAEEVLKSLREDYDVILLTKGDREVQEQRIEKLRLAQLMDAIYIVDTKTEIDFAKIIAERHLFREQSWMVGNSLRSDIVPATRAGLRTIWISTRTWSYEDRPLPVPPGTCIAHSLKDVVPIIRGD